MSKRSQTDFIQLLLGNEQLFRLNQLHLKQSQDVFSLPEGTARFDRADEGFDAAIKDYRELDRQLAMRRILAAGPLTSAFSILAAVGTTMKDRAMTTSGVLAAGAVIVGMMAFAMGRRLRVEFCRNAICRAYQGSIATGYLEQESGYAQSRIAREAREKQLSPQYLRGEFETLLKRRAEIEQDYQHVAEATARYFAGQPPALRAR